MRNVKNIIKVFLICCAFVGRVEGSQAALPNLIKLSLENVELEQKWWNIVSGKGKLNISFEITNSSKDAIWVCVSRAYDEEFVTDVEKWKEGQVLKIQLRSYAFNKKITMLESLVKGRFQKILPGEHLKYKLVVLFPIITKFKIHLGDISAVHISLQYYRSLVIDKSKTCCEKTSNPRIVLIDSFWVYDNPGENIESIFSIGKTKPR